ncbi:hypothetical protein HKBW3S42_02097, partial [Candidatus Hakubella thermalkaliphila]
MINEGKGGNVFAPSSCRGLDDNRIGNFF